ncbi:hypothetical protein CYY_006762 [Polysphondylium violaceum]|uniref:Translation initiation factor eIF2B subunit epsilon n=1 Tax=Polysphondylium violaceum TaxID=133409 RepID=A0A8J4UY24_9MYCE|nr:hypothetical protein CYY_006762 [Polysphondylium violaceum]
MAVEKKKSGAGGSSSSTTLDIKSDDKLQAVVLGDSFDRQFSPITLEKPRTLLPLVNIPLLDYTLEFLASSGIAEIFVFCCAHSEQIKEYIKNSRWSNLPGLSVKTMVGKDCITTGDALRAIYNSHVIQNDFVLISGDVVSNMNLTKALAIHKTRREQDKDNIMTMVFKQASPSHRTRSKQDDSVVGVDSETLQLISFQNSLEKKKVHLPISTFKKHPSVQLRYDLIDCHIDICSPEVLALFNDNFDFTDIRKDFIHDILSSELLDYKLSTYVLQNEYAARVKDLPTYHSVSKDIIHRWTFPMVPDNNFMCNTSYSLSRQMIYKERGVKLLGDCFVGEETVIGFGSQIGESSHISHSIIGRNCVIGKNVKIVGSYIWDNCVIQDNVTITSAVMCCGARALENSTIGKGCIISFNAVIGHDYNVEEFTKISLYENDDSDNEDEDEDASGVAIHLGKDGVGKQWITVDQLELVPRSEVSQEIESESDSDSVCSEVEDYDEVGDVETDYAKFIAEVKETVKRGINEKLLLENIQLEINGLKFAYDRGSLDCLTAILPVLLEVPNIKSITLKEMTSTIQKNISKYAKILSKFSSEEIQLDFIFNIVEFCDENEEYKAAFQSILHSLYENDVISEEAIFEWADETENDEDEENHFYLNKCRQFINWLKEAEEESEDEDDDDEDEDD